MVAPVTGPHTKFFNQNNIYIDQVGYRQQRPYTVPTAFVRRFGAVAAWNHSQYNNDSWRFAAWADGERNNQRVYAQAYAKLVDKLGENAGLGVTLAQWKQADEMIRNRGNQLRSFTSALVRRSPLGVASALGVSAAQVKKIMSVRYGTAKSLADLWLEFWFGWKPAVSDIYTACEVFDNFIPWARLRGAASATINWNSGGTGLYSETISYKGKVGCRVGLDVRLVNPNVRLMQQFGILNPLGVAWDAIPWSFVVGWFANVGQWLSSFTDFAGFETSNGFISRRVILDDVRPYWRYYGWEARGVATSSSREVVTTLPRPRLMMNEFSMKPLRALTSISLLSQQLHRVANAR